jgi:breast cancer 2 susceptibility protein
MILIVAAIHHPGPSTDPDEKDAPPPRPYLELSDGWYKILAEIDDCLARAISTGKIRVGRKLAISGAKLDSGSEGADVLEAFDKSRLIISGNSTSMARWHSKLGVQPTPFVAGLPSLTNDGGLIVLMDVVIEKLYPIAYIWGGSGHKEAPWNESEESIRSDAWRVSLVQRQSVCRLMNRTNTKLNRQAWGRKCVNSSKVSKIWLKLSVRQLKISLDPSTVSSTKEGDSNWCIGNPPETLDRDFDILVSSNKASAKIRGMSNSNIAHLATYARERLQQEMADGDAEIERELRVRPITTVFAV